MGVLVLLYRDRVAVIQCDAAVLVEVASHNLVDHADLIHGTTHFRCTLLVIFIPGLLRSSVEGPVVRGQPLLVAPYDALFGH